jgi:hypothetical protein
VQVEGWVKEEDTRASVDSGALKGVTAAEVRANPGRYLGKAVDWRLQFLAVHRHYGKVAAQLSLQNYVPERRRHNTVLVPIGGVHRAEVGPRGNDQDHVAREFVGRMIRQRLAVGVLEADAGRAAFLELYRDRPRCSRLALDIHRGAD